MLIRSSAQKIVENGAVEIVEALSPRGVGKWIFKFSTPSLHELSYSASVDRKNSSGTTSIHFVTSSRSLKGLTDETISDNLDAMDAVYPRLTKELLVEYLEGTKGKKTLFGGSEINPNSYITLNKLIAVGEYAAYYIGTENETKKPKTVKIYRPKLINARAGREKQILSLSSKPAAIPSLDFAFRYELYKCLVLEPLYNDSLSDKLLYARRFAPDVVQSFMVDMICAIAFLHNHKIIHRNLSLDSFWIQANNRLKLTDFSQCTSKRSMSKWSPVFYRTTTNYTAPELLKRRPYSQQSDIWALGIIFYRMIAGRFPFYGENLSDLRENIKYSAEQYSDFFSPQAQFLCGGMLEKYPEHRMGYKTKTESAFQDHPYFEGIGWRSANHQVTDGPRVRWKFSVSKQDRTGHLPSLQLKDIDEQKFKKKYLRMDALRGGQPCPSTSWWPDLILLETGFKLRDRERERNRVVTTLGDHVTTLGDHTAYCYIAWVVVDVKARILRQFLPKKTYRFSPEYLEQVYPRPVSEQRARPSTRQASQAIESRASQLSLSSHTIGRPSTVRKMSLHHKLIKAFIKLEETMEEGDDNMSDALENYYSSVAKGIDKYSREKEGKTVSTVESRATTRTSAATSAHSRVVKRKSTIV